MSQYRKYWQDPRSVSDCVVWKMLLVMAVGVFFCPGSAALQSRAAAWIMGGRRWLARHSVECAQFDLNTVQICCLLFVNSQTSRERSEPFGLLKETLICMAMKLGFPQESSKHFPPMSASEAEMRQRLWTTVLKIAIQSSFDSGLLPLIFEGYNCTTTSNLDDADLLGTSSLAPQPLPVFTQSTVSMVLASTQRIRLRILHLMNAPGTTLTYQDTLQLTKELDGISNENLARMQSLTASSTRPTNYIKILDARANPCYYYSRKVRMEATAVLLSNPLL
ncbi:fungal specific transcription factor domain-containing protein [Aspergillus udagawae]|uniref:Xylanolytic transcriptional activator regulatory domain-containing protein n=1 Tax=Aspergillus udagawae TaxID=91492 RepID=A0A8E0QZ92_9EURO|nr:uncharacterized protein Aud_009539 [Aspergillus udagawae]GIC93060.1 hypothetical protein Aud_009539 [Aspergillus udagawae]